MAVTAVQDPQVTGPDRRRLRDRVEAEAYVASVCFKHGPPKLHGVELEWIVHHEEDPRRPLDPRRLVAALGPHAPRTLTPDSPQQPLPSGSPLTVEPGGQVEISALPRSSLAELFDAVHADLAFLTELLAAAGLVLGDKAVDPHRSPARILDTPRYAAMEHVFESIGPHGITMMCCTAGLQVCLDAGEADTVAQRWAAVSALGPVLVAAFANSPTLSGSQTGWASARMRAVLGTDPARSFPSAIVADPAADWARRVLDTPVLCVRGEGARWHTPAGLTFADWVAGGLPTPPTTDDLDYHLSTLFPPVRPHGYLEVRYLDAQAGSGWVTPTALLSALVSDRRTVDAVLDACLPVGDRWLPAARDGLADRAIARAATTVLELGAAALPGMGLPAGLTSAIVADLDRLTVRSSA
ncbi:ergothioneine biosynthesis glutamate--cysteine ligase EgtA [Actinophytocola algeriensis]|uniref:ergothioneine biosynthesis glutamate--cysteine ligase EgtA n=1 Tax=Actinophytocola algeriensis TaxID=1768010 RepID=UPI0016155D03